MKILILEDEQPAVRHLTNLLKRYAPEAEICDSLDTVTGAVQWLKNNNPPDLILSDIRLADGLSFEVFKSISVKCPIIFTTAYDRFAIQAFKLNSIDYLLKPIDGEELEAALEKFDRIIRPSSPSIPDLESLTNSLQQLTRGYKSRFVVRTGERLKAINTQDIMFFFSKDKITFMKTGEGKRYVIDHTLEQLEHQLDPEIFFRVNRQYIVRIEAVTDMVYYSSTKLKLTLKHMEEDELFVSRQRLNDFREWLDK